MKVIDQVEAPLKRDKGKVRLYTGQEIDVVVYKRDADTQRGTDVDSDPNERYLDIIIEGCRLHKVNPSHM